MLRSLLLSALFFSACSSDALPSNFDLSSPTDSGGKLDGPVAGDGGGNPDFGGAGPGLDSSAVLTDAGAPNDLTMPPDLMTPPDLTVVPPFSAPLVYPVGMGPNYVAVGDFDGDRKVDLVVSNGGAGTLSVLIGNNDGTFMPKKDYTTNGAPNALLVADVNGDFSPDVVTVDQNGAEVYLNKADGHGTLNAAVTYAVGPVPLGVAYGDMNNDGKGDIIAANAASDNISVLLSNGDGTFQAQKLFNVGTGGEAPVALAVGDLNGDGKLDLVSVNGGDNPPTLSVMINNTMGTNLAYKAPQKIPAGMGPNSIVARDLLGNGKLDLVVVNITDNNMWVYLGNGDGTFQNPAHYPAGRGPNAAAVADFDGDGIQDIAVSNGVDSTVSVFTGAANGAFFAAKTYPVGAAGHAKNPAWIAAGKLNTNTKLSIVTANNTSNDVSILLNQQ